MNNFSRDTIIFRDCRTKQSEKLIKDNNLSKNQFCHIVYIGEEKRVTPSTISIDLKFDNAHTTRILKTLQKRGLIIKETDPTDRRRVFISLTSDGYRIYEQTEFLLDSISNYLLKYLTPEEAANLNIYFDKIKKGAGLDDKILGL